jgi:hypothetical protein
LSANLSCLKNHIEQVPRTSKKGRDPEPKSRKAISSSASLKANSFWGLKSQI